VFDRRIGFCLRRINLRSFTLVLLSLWTTAPTLEVFEHRFNRCSLLGLVHFVDPLDNCTDVSLRFCRFNRRSITGLTDEVQNPASVQPVLTGCLLQALYHRFNRRRSNVCVGSTDDIYLAWFLHCFRAIASAVDYFGS